MTRDTIRHWSYFVRRDTEKSWSVCQQDEELMRREKYVSKNNAKFPFLRIFKRQPVSV
jgi:hypothetical protein